MNIIEKLTELLALCESHGHNERFPWDRGYHEGYKDALEIALGYAEKFGQAGDNNAAGETGLVS